MFAYALKRILIMFPTLLAILVLVFVLVNIAPGSPGEALNASNSEQAQESADARESYRRFKEQYNLDKPIVLNLRYRLSRSDVEDELLLIARNMSSAVTGEAAALAVGDTTARIISEVVNREYNALDQELRLGSHDDETRAELSDRLGEMARVDIDPIRPLRPEPGRYRRAEERVEDWGADIVPFLVEIANETNIYCASDGSDCAVELRNGTMLNHRLTAKVRFLAVQRLSVNAQRRLIIRPGERGTEQEREANAEIRRENNHISRLTYALDAPAAERSSVISDWNAWYDERSGRYERTASQQVARVFLDTRFARYMGNLSPIGVSPRLHFKWPDLGTSMRFNRPVTEVINDHWRYSIFLSLASLLLSYLISVPLGVLGAVRQGSLVSDRGVKVLLFILYSFPSFFAATLLQTWFTEASSWGFLPVSGFDSGRRMEMTTLEYAWDVALHMVLPVICLTYASLAALSRYARTGLLDVIRSDYIRTARAKGLPEWIVITKHAVRNGMIPIITLLGSTLPVLIGGSVIIEYIFGISGIGALMLNSILFRDYNVIMGILLLSSVLTLIGILLSDLAYALVDPRISFD